jgi:hypothetical protein
MIKKAQPGAAVKANKPAKKKTYPLLGIETPTPGSENGKRGVPLSKNIQDGIKSGKLNKDGSWKGPLKNGGKMKKAQNGTRIKYPDGPVDSNKISLPTGRSNKFTIPGPKNKIVIPPKKAKSGTSMKKCKYGCK